MFRINLTSVYMIIYLFVIPSYAAATTEYNVWYQKEGVMYDVTQTLENEPVLISITANSSPDAVMVITLKNDGACDATSVQEPLKIDFRKVSVSRSCLVSRDIYFVTYVIKDLAVIDYVLKQLRAGFTVVLMDSIKIWAGNINKPLHGYGKWFQNQ